MNDYNKYLEACSAVKDKYEVAKENGCVSGWYVVLISVPEMLTDDFLHPNYYGISAIDYTKKLYPNAQVKFEEIDEIKISFNVVKTV